MESNQNLLNNDLQIDAVIQSHLKESAMWARFLGIVGFILTAFIAIAALFAGTLISKMISTNPYGGYSSRGSSALLGGFLTIVYLIIAVISFIISLFTYRFGTRTKQALLQSDQESLNKGLMNLKFVFRFYGIIMVIYIAIIALAIVVGIAGAAFGR